MNNLKYYIDKALKEGFALGAFNFNNMESLQAIAEGCKECRSPAIISVSEGALEYMGEKVVKALANAVREDYPFLFLHLDHGKSVEVCKKAIELGFDSVMIDGSALGLEENIKITKEVCEIAHPKNILVEGELGQIKGIEDNVEVEKQHYTNPKLAKVFIEKTGVDLLAVAIGTSHGAYKYSGEQTLRFDILSEIEREVGSFPLVLHGASTVDKYYVDQINKFGGKLNNPLGVPRELIVKAVKEHNIVKINTDTDLRLAMTAGVREVLNKHPEVFDMRKYLGKGRENIKELVKDKIENLFFSKL